MRAHVIALVTLLTIAMTPATGRAQARLTGADIDGTVTDQSGSTVPGCTIVVTNADTNIARTVVTDTEGRYHAPALPPGTYTVSAMLAGFKTQSAKASCCGSDRPTRSISRSPSRAPARPSPSPRPSCSSRRAARRSRPSSVAADRGPANQRPQLHRLRRGHPRRRPVRATFSQEAIREFQVLVDSYSAEFGKAAGGVVNIVTKSGTNEYHGNAFG